MCRVMLVTVKNGCFPLFHCLNNAQLTSPCTNTGFPTARTSFTRMDKTSKTICQNISPFYIAKNRGDLTCQKFIWDSYKFRHTITGVSYYTILFMPWKTINSIGTVCFAHQGHSPFDKLYKCGPAYRNILPLKSKVQQYI